MANVLGVIRKAFPFIAAAASIGGPLATMAANAVGKALGVDKPPDSTSDAISDAIAGATPEQLIKLKEAEGDLKVRLAQLGFENVEDLENIAEADRASARARQIALRDRMPAILATAVTVGFFGVLWLVSRGVNPQAHDVMVAMVGVLGSAWMSVVTYYFGSSSGSARKTEILANGNGH